MTILETSLAPSRPYWIGSGTLCELPSHLKNYPADRIFLICDDFVYPRHGNRLLQSFRDQGWNVTRLKCPRGEAAKTMMRLEGLCEQLICAGVTKDSILVALGGGATGNLVGMAAALLYRGIRFVQVPSTMMAQTDSVLSNKQAVNSTLGKNLFGAYHAPLLVWSDTELVQTEDELQIRSAMVESFKNAFISDPELLQALDLLWVRVRGKDSAAIHEVVVKSVESKVKILRRDPSERGYAMCLEYGHTFGHALEILAAGRLTHGQAVAMGMMYAARLSMRIGGLDREAVELHKYYLHERLGLGVTRPPEISAEVLWQAMQHDNKRTGEGSRFVLLERIGRLKNEDQNCLTRVPEGLVWEVLQSE